MIAIISGQAAVALLLDGAETLLVRLDDDTPRPTTRREAYGLFRDATDSFAIHDADLQTASSALEAAWTTDRLLRLTLSALERRCPREDKQHLLVAAEELAASEQALATVADRLYSSPLPSTADVQSAIAVAAETDLPRLHAFLLELRDDQQAIRERRLVWDSLPPEEFDNPADKGRLCEAIIDAGLFRQFVMQRGNEALFQALAHPRFRGDPQARRVFQAWAKPFRITIADRTFSHEKEDPPPAVHLGASIRVRPHDAFVSASRQKVGIKEHLLRGNYSAALEFIDDLVREQRQNGSPEYTAKSLCDIAQFAKQLGDHELQRDLSERATHEDPSDPWSFIQLGDAFRLLGDFEHALNAFSRAGAAGDEVGAMFGRAEVLKDLGQAGEALTVYEECEALQPRSVVIRNAHASALATFGRLEEAVALYDTILSGASYDPVTLGGKAQVLREMGRSTEALRLLEETVAAFPTDPVSAQMHAEVLRDLGRFEEGLAVLNKLLARGGVVVAPLNSRAKIYKEMGSFETAIQEYLKIIASYPKDPGAFLGLADVYRKLGRLDEAIVAYRETEAKFSRVAAARTGRAAILVSKGQYSEALAILPTDLPATLGEWVAYHVRCMAYLRSGRHDRAQSMLEWGASQVPWAGQRRYFETALASLRLHRRDFASALELLRSPSPMQLQPAARVLQAHALYALGEQTAAEAMRLDLDTRAAPPVLRCGTVVRAVFARTSLTGPVVEAASLLEAECDMLLLAAA